MEDSNKKRSNSFRKLFPSVFFANKSKNKNQKEKNVPGESSKGNQIARLTGRTDKQNHTKELKHERIYENVTAHHTQKYENDIIYRDISSNNSSSSTLVSESVKHPTNHSSWKYAIDKNELYYTARPQVPPKPVNEVVHTQSNHNESSNSQYPDVYYHSLEHLINISSPVEEIETCKAPQGLENPTSVGAEIKRVSTKFLISPKKEAEVRTIQPKRARSLSFNNEFPELSKSSVIPCKNELNVNKPYNYSAPTSPMPVSHKIPNMPKTVSPYEHVRKIMTETEEKRNSLNRLSNRNTSPSSPRIESSHIIQTQGTISSPVKEHKLAEAEKEKTRQKVEIFYWQKLKELKEKEEEYFLRQSMNTFISSPDRYNTTRTHSSCSTPNSLVGEHKSHSLPRGKSLNTYTVKQTVQSNSPFVRGAPERRTDTNVNPRNFDIYSGDPAIVYRHPEKLFIRTISPGSRTNMQQQSFPREPQSDNQNVVQQTKRVSFEEQYPAKARNTIDVVSRDARKSVNTNIRTAYHDVFRKGNGSKESQKIPPQPPVRSSSAHGNVAIVTQKKSVNSIGGSRSIYSESESGSEAGEIQRILQSNAQKEDDWHGDGSRNDGGLSDGEASRGPSRGRTSRRDDPRRHTLAGNHLYVHPHHSVPGQHNTLDMERYRRQMSLNPPEYATVVKCREAKPIRTIDPRMRKPPLPRYPPPTNNFLFDDDPGIMSEVETASTGFRRGGKQRSSLPVVRTPSKTLERPLGLVFLQYRNETKRALLPNEITSIDTVKALFVRSFPKQLTMQYLDSPLVKIYIHDSSKDMFYELEDVRAHLRDIRDRSVLRLFEATDMGGGVFPGAVGVGSLVMPSGAASCSGPNSWDADQNYFSEPEIESDYHHQHVHKSKVKAPAYYMGASGPTPSTLPRGGSLMRAFSPAAPPVPADRVKNIPGSAHAGEGYMSSPERGASRTPYEDPYYTQFLGPATGRPTIAPVIDEETGNDVMIDDSYQIYGVNPITNAPRAMPRSPYDGRVNPPIDEMQRLRVEKMERQLANLTGLVQKALQVPGSTAPVVAPRQEFQTYVSRPAAQDAARFPSTERPPKLGRDKFQKSVSFEKSVSFSDEPPDMSSPKAHSPQHSERDRLKPAPPPKPAGLVGPQMALVPQRTYNINVTPEFFNQLTVLQKQSRDLRIETRNLRRSTLSHAIQMRQLMADTIVKIGALAASFCQHDPDSQLTREEEIYRQDMLLLENDLYELEATVERLRGQAANRETRVNMADIERIAMVLSKSSKTVADWKLKFPILQDTMKVKLASEMEKVVRKEKMLEEEPERLELALRRCKKLTGTLVTLKRLACVQEQRLPITDGRMADGRISPGSSQSSTFTGGPSSEEFASDSTCPQTHNKGAGNCVGRGAADRGAELRPENALDALLDELQTFAKPAERERGGRGEGSLRRLHSYPSGSDTDASPPVRARGQHPPKPPVPERHPELLAMAARRAPPPPPPRTTSRSPLASPTSPTSPPRPDNAVSSDCTSADDKTRQAVLEQRHQELLKKQRALQEQYARLQMIQRSGPTLPPNAQPDLKKTGSESNLLTKMNLNLAPAPMSGSMTHLAADGDRKPSAEPAPVSNTQTMQKPETTTNKIYETDIL
ncbi:coiled-coil domain-containing protein AGAP005037 isoform X4 [Hyposmocoma kahamanoa]|uniref:coiled-coil domain-containing protein AGAP005037 isoform X4 n=1 Tax=Hyposmocoma kahamanoa TaxID=1477025 RepID=UPI000E6DA3FA|nr:coiled-coil domain-containing protein AGAP005037 isoform X4 [Hyposmocoma kahamanoa]